MLGVGELEARVRQHVEEEAVALAEHDAHAVVGQSLHAFDGAKVALEVGGGADLAAGLVAVEGQVEPRLHVRRREGRAVMPQGIVPEREGPLRLRGVHGPGLGQVGAGQVEVLAAAHDQVAGAEQCAAHVVQCDAAGAHGVEAGGRVAAVGEDHHAAVGPVGRERSGRGRRKGDSRSGAVRGGRGRGRRARVARRGGSGARPTRLIAGGAGQGKERTGRDHKRSDTESHTSIVLGKRAAAQVSHSSPATGRSPRPGLTQGGPWRPGTRAAA